MVGVMTLKLDSSFKPLGIISWKDALWLILSGKAYAVEFYEKYVKSVKEMFQLPSVIVLKQFIKYEVIGPPCTRKNIFIRDEFSCQYCGIECEKLELTIDHVIPRSKGGNNSWTNLVAACKKCNQKKGDKTLSQVGLVLQKRPKKPGGIFSIQTTPGIHDERWFDYF